MGNCGRTVEKQNCGRHTELWEGKEIIGENGKVEETREMWETLKIVVVTESCKRDIETEPCERQRVVCEKNCRRDKELWKISENLGTNKELWKKPENCGKDKELGEKMENYGR